MANQYKRLFDMAFDPMAILRLDGSIKDANHAVSNAFGWDPMDLKELNFWAIVFPKSQANVTSLQQNLDRGHPVILVEVDILCKNKQLRQFQLTAYPDLNSETIAMVLRESKDYIENRQMFELAAKESPTAIMVVSDSVILYVNPSAEMIFGYSEDELIGKPIEVLVPLDRRINHHQVRDQYNHKPHLRLMGIAQNLSGLHKNGNEFPVDIGLNPVQTPDGLVVVCSIIDMTHKIEVEKLIKEKIQNLEELVAVLDTLSNMDKLTSVRNRRALDMQLELQFRIAQSNNEPISFILFDIDDFKQYNDTYGHVAGDRVLSIIGEILTTHLRRSEIIARYGGDEFGIILPGINSEDALHTAMRLRELVEEYKFPSRQITITMGCATLFPKIGSSIDSENLRNFIRMADRALYFSKQSGKNQVTHYNQLTLNPDEELSKWHYQFETPPD